MSEKYHWFKGIRFTRDDKTGYYANSTIHKRMHVYVWEYYNGKVPKGYQVHHIDMDKSNNCIGNLQLLTKSEHMKLHGKLLTDKQREWRRNNLKETARPKASEWHKSESGRLWHSDHIKKQRENGGFKKDLICTNCGNEYVGESKGDNHFCCNACKSAYRRKMGLDLIEKTCKICGNTFKTSKYSKSITCSQSCSNKLRWKTKHENKVS